jgi:hypothetical protein
MIVVDFVVGKTSLPRRYISRLGEPFPERNFVECWGEGSRDVERTVYSMAGSDGISFLRIILETDFFLEKFAPTRDFVAWNPALPVELVGPYRPLLYYYVPVDDDETK